MRRWKPTSTDVDVNTPNADDGVQGFANTEFKNKKQKIFFKSIKPRNITFLYTFKLKNKSWLQDKNNDNYIQLRLATKCLPRLLY